MKSRLKTTAAISVALLVFSAVTTATGKDDPDAASEASRRAAVIYLRDNYFARRGVIVYYKSDDCGREFIRFPTDASRMLQSVISPGRVVVRLGEKDVLKVLLNTKLHRLRFQGGYDPSLGISDIFSALEVKRVEREQRIRKIAPLEIISLIMPPPRKGDPRLPASLSDVTVDGALEVVAETFHAIVFVGACEGAHSYDVSFVEM